MPIKISIARMCLEIAGTITAIAIQHTDGWWTVTGWPQRFRRDQAVAALTVTELLTNGCDSSHPVVPALRLELQP
jgi:hypothetical protein